MNPSISKHMTRKPHTIGANRPLSLAHEIMRKHRVRHLLVLEMGELVGVVSQRDLFFLETLKDVDPSTVLVGEAMTTDLYTVTLRTTLRTVVKTMAARKLGSAVVLDGGKVAGIFTTTDALRVLAELFTPARPSTAGGSRDSRPS